MLGFYQAVAKLRAYLLRFVGSAAREKACWRWWQIPSRFARTDGRSRCLDYWRLIPCGSVPEIIVEGETGFMVEDIDRAVEAVGKIEQISRARCRREFEQRFTDRHMAEDYIRIYQQLLSRSSSKAAA